MGRTGRSTLLFGSPVYIRGGAAVAGPLEGQGPLATDFDKIYEDRLDHYKTWEDMETGMQIDALGLALQKCGVNNGPGLLIGGDLLNQITVTNFTALALRCPFLGLYNACATMAEGLLTAAALISGGFSPQAAVVASSHNSTSERQYRFPTELGVQRPQWAQWTVTAAGAMLLSAEGAGPVIRSATIGRVVDYQIDDPNQMGAAMAPAAFDTLVSHLQATHTQPQDYDLILTGDLGGHGHDILLELCRRQDVAVDAQLQDGGCWIYGEDQDVHAGGSGAGCSAAVWSSHLLKCMAAKKYRRVLLIGTGALLSPTSTGQGRSIPAIAHAVMIEN